MRGYPYWAACILRRGFFSHRTHRSNGTFLAHVSSPQDSGPSPQPLPRREGRSMRGYPYWAACILRRVFFSHRTHRFNRNFQPTFRSHRRPSAYRDHRAFQLKMAVRFCDICRPQGLCGMLCVLFICVNL